MTALWTWELISFEWTFDPLLVPNAHLNLRKLGAVVQEYPEHLYGGSLAPVAHRGIPTDRFIAAWNIRDIRVERHLATTVFRAEVLTLLDSAAD